MAHEPIQFGPRPGGAAQPRGAVAAPTALDLKKDEALTLTWPDGRVDRLPIALLRRHSPSAENAAEQDTQHTNPLHVLKQAPVEAAALTATEAELVGRYAIRIGFSDGHRTGLFDWRLLRQLGDLARAGERDS